MARVLYDLCVTNNLRISPYCWRVKLSLAHKNLEYKTIPVGFTEKYKLNFSNQYLVPVLDDNGKIVNDSWSIAEYLEATYPDAPELFPEVEGKHLAKLITEWIDGQHKELLSFFILDLFNRLEVEDRDYFRRSREERYGKSLEEIQLCRDDRIADFREVKLAALRAHLTDRAFICGKEPAYGDFAVFGTFQWARLASKFDLLAPGDPIGDWRQKMISRFSLRL